MTTETQGEVPPSVLYGGVLDLRLDDWAHGKGVAAKACLQGVTPSGRGHAIDILRKYLS